MLTACNLWIPYYLNSYCTNCWKLFFDIASGSRSALIQYVAYPAHSASSITLTHTQQQLLFLKPQTTLQFTDMQLANTVAYMPSNMGQEVPLREQQGPLFLYITSSLALSVDGRSNCCISTHQEFFLQRNVLLL